MECFINNTNSIKDVINSEFSQGFQFKAHCGRNGYSLLRQCNAVVNVLKSSLRAGFKSLNTAQVAFDIE